jgi:hypothetical protein
MLQISDDNLQKGQAIVLEFDLRHPSGLSNQTYAEIIGIHSDGAANELEAILVKIPARDIGCIAKQVNVGFGVYTQYVGQKLSVRFTNNSTTADISLDSISLKVFSEKPNNHLVFNDSWDDQCDQLWAGQYFGPIVFKTGKYTTNVFKPRIRVNFAPIGQLIE